MREYHGETVAAPVAERVMRLRVDERTALFAVSALLSPLGAQSVGLPIGTVAPAALVQTLDGKSVDLKQFIGATPVDAGIPKSTKELTLGFRYNDLASV